MSVVYFASPYTHKDPQIENMRYKSALYASSWGIKEGYHVYSPIVHCHVMARKFGLRGDFKFWCRYNFAMVDKADEFWMLLIDGWKESVGMAGELDRARGRGIPIRYVQGDFLCAQPWSFVDPPAGYPKNPA